ncbi:MAG: nicotinate-nucleotide--dimethylbenzimidazole phosphoribosyltransferase [Deltaproteobacteria bacterium]|nr:nicotinate-nucleotide--dimethylbenzimidazole phosphoribosyltransferase [Deltaproteobacteria bacterium]
MSLLKETVGAIVAQDPKSRAAARARLEQLTMPHWALGRLMDLAGDLAGMTRSLRPPVERKAVVVMAGDHGVAAESVSKFPQEVTRQMVLNFVNGGAGINALARVSGARVVVVDMGVAGDLGPLAAEGKILSRRIGAGTGNMAVGPAMSREDAIRSVEAGIEVALMLAAETDLFATGDMGIANTTPSSAIVSVMTGAAAADVTGRGTGIDDAGLSLKVAVIEKALAVNRPDPDDALDVLAKVGGFEIGGIAGLILGAASLRKPVLVDGFISTAGALIAQGLAPRAADYMIAAHKSVEAGHRIALQKLGKEPLLDLGLRLGEGTGAALAMSIVEGAVRVLTEVATFEEAAVSGAVT